MQAYGSDRVRPGERDQLVLLSRIPKGWTARAEKTLTSAEFPGTAVLWEERYFEVVDAQPLPQGGAQYILEPWREMHIMRTTDRYDEESEAGRMAEYRASLARENRRRSANVLAIFVGHFPAAVQQEMGRELGISPTRMTIVSVLPVYAIVIGLVLWIVSGLTAQTPRPLLFSVLTGYLLLESSFRFTVAWLMGRPLGSPAGVLGYLLYYATVADRARAVPPFAREKGTLAPVGEVPEERAATDSLMMREALVTLLDPADQARVASRFGYDYRRQSARIALIILVCALLGVASSVLRGAMISLLVAAAIAAEQVYRLVVLRHRPAGSLLGIAARPFVRKLL